MKTITLITLMMVAPHASWSEDKPEESRTPEEQKMLDLKEKVTILELENSELKQQLKDAQEELRNLTTSKVKIPKGLQQVRVPMHPADTRGKPVEAKVANADPSKGFIQGDAIDTYRSAMILFEAGSYSDSILRFSSFVEAFADHPLAGSAQFFVGESYYRQGEHKLALREYRRILTAYDRNNYLPQAIKRISECEEKLGHKKAALEHRQLLLALFPQSPAAAEEMVAQNLINKGASPSRNHSTGRNPTSETMQDEKPRSAPLPNMKDNE